MTRVTHRPNDMSECMITQGNALPAFIEFKLFLVFGAWMGGGVDVRECEIS